MFTRDYPHDRSTKALRFLLRRPQRLRRSLLLRILLWGRRQQCLQRTDLQVAARQTGTQLLPFATVEAEKKNALEKKQLDGIGLFAEGGVYQI